MIKKHTFKLDHGVFTGDGWDRLAKLVKAAHFVMIGEDHGLAEVPPFCTQIANILQPKAVVTEIDPYTAMELKKISPYPLQYSTYFKKHPYAFAFYSYQTEMEMIRQLQLKKIDIWGLNEINFLSLDRFFITLAANAKLPANKKLAMEKATRYGIADRPIFTDFNRYGEFSAYKMQVATADSLLQAFKNESPLCKQMLENLKLSIPIYPNNNPQLRVNLMKRNLLNYLAPVLAKQELDMPKLLFKFGANHVTRSNNVTNMYEVGSLADNLAEGAGKKTLHILVLGKDGTINQMAPTNNKLAIQPYHGLPSFNPFTEKVDADEWAFFDLRQIRNNITDQKLLLKNGQLRDFLLGYDVLVVFGKTTGNPFIE